MSKYTTGTSGESVKYPASEAYHVIIVTSRNALCLCVLVVKDIPQDVPHPNYQSGT